MASAICPKGHPLSGSNVYVSPKTGWRTCIACRKEAQQRWYEQRGRAQRRAHPDPDRRLRRKPEPSKAGRILRPEQVDVDLFWSKVQRLGEDDCWPWQGATVDGYGVLTYHGRKAKAYRLAYELERGPIPVGLTIDHLCRNPICVNPAHLEPVTMLVNVLRGVSPAAQNARKTHCVNGHEFTEANTRIRYSATGRVGRQCRACRAVQRARAAQRVTAGADAEGSREP